ncbi:MULTISPECIES: Crp/Fnr family transcriptional regulator [Alphaproteobacteria]|uniref:Crp/Fnr family transcriptional regulator n=2 Tax=Alphaproteobacteria TaxID=28211 RepID=A0A512HN52_9HYPH|nr:MULTISPECIES: Crp/Fnr family transcriptional regulator [Alphaproteobacteria]GEO86872.1 Crp/Fnr family transcriptional regulator [Ciceribacter naphthalenivorans]GLR24016.1 Crp/Fnr family transcriptional regulator [Ciceribacter naphthalenivorans]GLT06872.1 Crp/Fnr family transcriptional regulator [Sphingomonas psychrolutea]
MGIDDLPKQTPADIQYSRASNELAGACLRHYAVGSTIFEPGDDDSSILFVNSGWAICAKILPNGTRIVTEFALRGDLISTKSSALAQETIQALSPVSLYEFPDRLLGQGSDLSPQLTKIIVSEMIKRLARLSERIANIGRRDALERTGHLLLELGIRASEGTKADFDGFVCPLKQSDIGDAVGLSTVHINRVLKDLRTNGLLSFRNGIVEFLDRRRLMELVDFNPGYLASRIG